MKYVLAVLAMCLVGCGKTKTCYWCKESIKEAALICKHCGKEPSWPEPVLKEKIQIHYAVPIEPERLPKCTHCGEFQNPGQLMRHQSTCPARSSVSPSLRSSVSPSLRFGPLTQQEASREAWMRKGIENYATPQVPFAPPGFYKPAPVRKSKPKK